MLEKYTTRKELIMKRRRINTLAGAVLFATLAGGMSGTVNAGFEANDKTILALQVNNPYYAINTQVTRIDDMNYEIAPVLQENSNDRVLIPVQALINAYNDAGKTVSVLMDDGTLIVAIDGDEKKMEQDTMQEINGSYYLTEENVNFLGFKTRWDEAEQMLLLTFDGILEVKDREEKLLAVTAVQAAHALSAFDNENADYMEVSVPESTYRLFESNPPVGMSEKDGPSYARAEENLELYPAAAETVKKDGVPEGTVTTGTFTSQKIYPGVNYSYSLYVPAQYDENTPANFMVFQDGGMIEACASATTVLDNMIAEGEMPVTIALFINAGDCGPGLPIYGASFGTNNRSIEYDSVDDLYAKFLIDELMPAVVGEYNLSEKPADHCIVGHSSSGNSALAVAWHRNDVFGRVISCSGSFVNIRGGNVWPYAIRSGEKRDLKMYMAVGEQDLNIIFGDWLTANYDVARAMEYAGYEYILTEYKAGHTAKILGYLLPDAIRWINSDSDSMGNMNLENLLVTGSGEDVPEEAFGGSRK